MLSNEYIRIIKPLKQKLYDEYRPANKENDEYFTGKNLLKSLKISLPPHLENMKAGVAYPATVVKAVEERVKLVGFSSEDDYGVDEIFFDNHLASESSMVHIDTLEYGTGYVVVGKGGEGEPDVLITPESPNNILAVKNLRTRKVEKALDIKETGNKEEAYGTLYLLNETVPFYVSEEGEFYSDGEIDYHNNNYIGVFQLVNNPQTSNLNGKSEITRVVKSNTDSAVRTLVDMEVTREYYGRPRMVYANVNMEEFRHPDGTPRDPFNSRADAAAIFGAGANADVQGMGGGAPTVTQIQAGDPSAMIPLLQEYATQIANHSGIPLHRMLNTPVNAPSADALRALEAPLISSAESKIVAFGRVWEEIIRYAVFLRDGEWPPAGSISAVFKKPETPTLAATTDSALKLVSAGIYTPDSELTKAALNLTTYESKLWDSEKGQARMFKTLEAMAAAKGPLPEPSAEDTDA